MRHQEWIRSNRRVSFRGIVPRPRIGPCGIWACVGRSRPRDRVVVVWSWRLDAKKPGGGNRRAFQRGRLVVYTPGANRRLGLGLLAIFYQFGTIPKIGNIKPDAVAIDSCDAAAIASLGFAKMLANG